MQLILNSFRSGEALPVTYARFHAADEEHACPAGNRSPHLAWSRVQAPYTQNPTLLSR
jgi:phosphatidylethanolamine-binding protein (PEBP) family uncharacterized protein